MKTASAFLVTALTLVPLTATFAQTAAPTAVSSAARHHGAPGPLMGTGPVGLMIGGVGFGVYWLVKRRRRKTTEV
jgi:hypothetical protein